MTIAYSKVTAQGQISVPAEIRRRLEVGPGALLEWDEVEGEIVVRRAGRHSFDDLHRALFAARRSKPKNLGELKAGVRRYIRTKHARR